MLQKFFSHDIDFKLIFLIFQKLYSFVFQGNIVTSSTFILDEKQQNKVKEVITFMIYSLIIWLKAVWK